MQDVDEDLEEDAMDEEAELQRFRAEMRTTLLSNVRNAHLSLPDAAVDWLVTAALAQFDPTAAA